MRMTVVARNYRRGLRGGATLASAAALSAAAAALATGGPPAWATVSHHPDAITPGAIVYASSLRAVSAVSASDAWAVGGYSTATGGGMLIMHWNGTSWTKSTPPSGMTGSLEAVSADSPTDAWAAGQYNNSSGVTVPLTLHWNGKKWNQVASPFPSGAQGANLEAVSADSATDAWAVGEYSPSSGGQKPLTLHWNGKKWNQVASPFPSGSNA